MYGKEISKCINAAEMGLTKRQAATLLDIQYSLVKELADKYGIRFVDGRSQAGNARRVIDSPKKKQATVTTDDRQGAQKPQAESKAAARGNPSSDGHCVKRVDEIYSSKMPRAEKYELIYAKKWQDFEQKLIKENKRPPFPKPKNFSIDSAANRLIKEQREESLAKRKMILACFDGKGHRVAEDISEQTKFNLRSSSQMLDLMYRDGLLTRERVQVGANRRNTVYHYYKD
tara:strand:- start:439 stop:1128 length:690 start_codon:yes stop_codon:yes gene_type:complete